MVPQAALPRLLPAPIHKARPPTPPRDFDNRPYLSDRGLPKEVVSQISSITPNSSAESPATATARKKVNWPTNGEINSTPIIKPLQTPGTSGERKPIKSILKPYNAVNVQSIGLGTTSKVSPPHSYPNLAAMLESIAQQLGGDDRNSKMDAYTTLSGTIKASDNVPELRALKEKMGILLQFMRRDLTARNLTGASDTPLIVNDLVLLSSFLHKPVIAEILPSDFCAYLVDHAIKTFEDPGMSKDVVKHLMFVLAQQKFSSKIMNEGRVAKLIKALHDIESFVKGKSIVTGRLDIYKCLIRNSRSYMLTNVDWLEDLFSDMLSSQQATRASAIELGLDSGLVLGTEGKASRAVMDIFQRGGTDEEAPKFADYFSGRLIEIIKQKKEYCQDVPRIWSVPVLFLRHRPRQFEQWAMMSQWVKVIQECFNCSDQATRLEANLAWNRLVLASRLDEKTSPKLVTMLSRPFLEQLKRKSKIKLRKSTFSSICVLLYYSFRPDAPSTQLDLYWKEYVLPIIGHILTAVDFADPSESASQDLAEGCRILRTLFDSTTPRPWKETRSMELSADSIMEPTELPALESKWLRKSAQQVFLVLDPLLEKLYWDLNEDSATITDLWKAFITSIAAPAAKEVKVSNETMSCIASVFNFLYRIWHIGPKSVRSLPPSKGSGSTDFLGSFGKIILLTIEGLGLLPFTEKLLSIGSQDTFIVIATPSHGARNPRGEILCPLHHLFALLTNLCPGLQYDSKFSLLVRQILAPFFNARPSSKARMDLVKDLLQLLPTERTGPSKLMWQILADFAAMAADMRDGNGLANSGNSDQPLGMDYRSALKILEVGIDLSPGEPLPGWQKVFEVLANSSTLDAGDGGRALAVIEPLARAFTAKFSCNQGSPVAGIAYCRLLVSKASFPKDRQALDAARRRLWGAVNLGAKGSASDPYVQLYEFLRGCLENSYASFTKEQLLQYSDVLSATLNLITRCPDALLLNVLSKLQKGIGCWILDDQSKLGGGTVLSQAVLSVWGRICSHVPLIKQTHDHAKILSELEVLFCSGLESKHRAIVNSAIRLWNSTFANCSDKLEYTPRITEALLRLRPVADLQLPFFPESLSIEQSAEHRQPLSFVETQDGGSSLFGSASLESIMRKPTPQLQSAHSKARKSTPQVIIEVKKSISHKRARDETPEFGKRKSTKRVSTPKLRHDDSQIQFAAIESSPMVEYVVDSQILTDRQKEVKERQQAEAAMFPDIRSSPRPKSAQRRSTSVELPFHRSSSKARSATSPDLERQTTPTLAPQVDYDDYVNSSPTPTRALSAHGDEVERPSSPTEASSLEQSQHLEEIDIPSSPPESYGEEAQEEDEGEEENPTSPPDASEERVSDTITSVEPSAQVDPLAIENDRTVSTFEFTSDEQNKSIISDSFIASKPPDAKPLAIVSELASDDASPAGELSQADEVEEVPNTPVRSRAHTPTPQQTPKTPVFHDALTSPASSDKITEVFQDAITSPMAIAEAEKGSSPLSDLDESSMLRIMTEFDQGSGKPKNVRFMSKNDNTAVTTSLPTRTLEHSALATQTSTETSSDNHHKESENQVDDKMDMDLTRDEDPQESSSMPSLIPETPHPGQKAKPAMIVIDGEEFDPEDTIIVDVPDDWDEVPKTKRRKKASPRKRSSLGLGTSASPVPKRRKHEEPEKRDKVLDSREAEVLNAPVKAGTTGKKLRGRPKRLSTTPVSSQSPSQSQLSSSQLSQDSPLGQSLSSVDLDSSMQDPDVIPATDAFTLSEKAPTQDESVILETAVKDGIFKAEAKTLDVAPLDESFDSGVPSADAPMTPDVEVVEETMIEERSSFHAAEPSAIVQQELDIGLPIPEPITERPEEAVSEEMTENAPQKVNIFAQTEIVEEPTETPIQVLRGKLQSLISDLGAAALSREEVNAIEDMFMDAKEQLFGAARRGRAKGL